MAARAISTRAGLLAFAAAVLGVASVRAPGYAIVFTACVCLLALGACVRHGWTSLALVLLAAVAILVTQATQGKIPSGWKLAGHVVLIPGLLLLWYYSRELPLRIRRGAYVGLGLMAISAAAGLLGGSGGLSDAVGAIWQEARWIGAIGVGYAIARSVGPSTRRWLFVSLLTLNTANLLVSISQIRGATETRFGIPVALGMFGHPTQTSVAGVVLLLFVITERRNLGRRERIAAAVVAVLELVLSVRLKSLIGVGAGLAVLGAVWLGVRPRLLAVACAALPVALTFALAAFTPNAGSYNAAESTGLATVYGHATTRNALFRGAQRLAAANFPLGAGLATFGSYLDERREFATLGKLGLASSYGFRRGESFLSDNYFAHILAERGYAGLLTWLLAITVFLWCALVSPSRFGLFSAVIIAASIALTPVLPVFRDGTDIILLFVPVGMYLWGVTQDWRVMPTRPDTTAPTQAVAKTP
jgi:hypothetical protein